MKLSKKTLNIIRGGLLSSVFILHTTSAHADPISAAITAAIEFVSLLAAGNAAAWTAVAVFALKTAAVMALSYVAQAIFGPTSNTPKPGGVNEQLRTGGDLPRAFIAGTYATAGSLVYGGSWGVDGNTKNAYITKVISLQDLPAEGLLEVWLGSNKLTWNSGLGPAQTWGTPIVEYRKDNTDYLWIKYYDGTQTVADPFLTGVFGADPEFPYTSDMVGTGVAYIIVTARFNTTLFSGIPDFKFAMKGAKWYDPRKDTTVGGSGSHRWATPSTWEWSDNPQVINYNIMRGVSYSGDWIWGPQGITAVKLPLSSWTAAMNACDVAVLDSNGVSHAIYRCGCEITVDMQPADVLESINMSCNARIAEVGGIYKPLVGPSGASVMSFTDGDILINQATSFDFFPSSASIVNGLTATYPEPAEGWTAKDAPARFNSTYEAADGRRLLANVNYATVPYASQVQYLMDSAIEEGRKFKKFTLPLPPKFWVLEPNDTITWTSGRNSFTNKAFRILSIIDKADLEVLAVIAETDPADYTFNTATDYLANPINPPVVTYPVILAPDPAMTALAQLQIDLADIAETLIKVSFAFNAADKSQYKTTASATQELTTKIIDGDSAQASYMLQLDARMAQQDLNIQASVTSEALARVTADSAEALAREALSASMTAYINGQIVVVNANIVFEANARVSADLLKADASVVSTLSSTVGGHTSTITNHTNTLNGISAGWGVTIDINGAITGRISLDGLGSTSTMTFLATQFNIYTTAGAFPVFSVSGTTVYINGTLQANSIVAGMITTNQIQLTHMTSNSVDTAQLVGNSATLANSSPFSGLITHTDTTFRDCGSVGPFVYNTGNVQIDFTCTIDNNDAANHKIVFKLFRNGTLLKAYPNIAGRGYITVGQNETPITLCWDDAPGPGTYTYAMAYACVAGDTDPNRTLEGVLRVSEIRR